jgi:hypothetical protein
MKKLIAIFQKFLLLSLLVGIIFAFVSQAHATWYWIHGHSAHIQDTAQIDAAFPMGWGLDVTQKLSTGNWYHFAVPSPGATLQGAQKIKVNFLSESDDVWIWRIDVWNGGTLITQFLPPSAKAWSNGDFILKLDLGSVTPFTRGLGISIGVSTGSDIAKSHRIIFNGAGANFNPITP